MFNTFTRSDLDRLIASEGGPHLSLFLAAPTAIDGAEQDRIRVGNLARQAHQILVQYWMSDSEADGFLEPLRNLADDRELRSIRKHGVAIFVADDSLELFRIDTPVEQQLIIARTFHVRPLLPSLERLESYFVLTLSKKRAALLAGQVDGLDSLNLPGLAEGFQQRQQTYTAQPAAQVHSADVRSGGKEGAVFHGQGGIPDSEQADLENYLKHVDDCVCSYLRKHSGAPLILAGDEPLIATYRSISSYGAILPDSISGNVDHLSAEQIWTKVSEITGLELDRRREQQATRIREHDIPQATDPEQILIAASEGRIDTLFVDREATLQGIFMADRGILKELQHAPTGDPGDASHDLIELAAVQTLKTGGLVHVVSADKMPVAKRMAAALRF